MSAGEPWMCSSRVAWAVSAELAGEGGERRDQPSSESLTRAATHQGSRARYPRLAPRSLWDVRSS